MKTNLYLEYKEKQIKEADVVSQAKKIWKDSGNTAASLKSMKLYVKPEDDTVYYVFNDDIEASFPL